MIKSDRKNMEQDGFGTGCLDNKQHFEKLFITYSQPLINFSRRLVIEKETAENIVQDVFVRIWINRFKINPNLNIKSYLYTAVKNQSFQHLRNLGIKERYGIEIKLDYVNSPTPEEELLSGELKNSIENAINALPEKCRLIFSMNRYDQLTYKEIADILNLSVKTIETQMGRALKFLRKRLSHFLSILTL